MSSPYTSRKFIGFVLVTILATVSLWAKFIEALIWRDVIIAVYGGYITANVAQKATAKPET